MSILAFDCSDLRTRYYMFFRYWSIYISFVFNTVNVDSLSNGVKLCRMERKMRLNVVIIYIFYNYVSINLLNVLLNRIC